MRTLRFLYGFFPKKLRQFLNIYINRWRIRKSLRRHRTWKEKVTAFWHWDLKNDTKDVYDRICDGFTKERFENSRESIVYSLCPQESDICLNIGCGIGRVEKYLHPKVKEIHSVDFSPQMIELAENRIKSPNVEFYLNDGESLRMFDNDFFDIAFAELLFQHIPPEIVKKYVAEVYRVLKSKGRFVCQIPNKSKYKHLPREICAWYTKQEVDRLFQKFSKLTYESKYSNDWYFAPIATK